MDYSMLIVLIIVIACVAIVYGIKELKSQNLISDEDLQLITQMFNLSSQLIVELNLKNEEKINVISNIVISALQYASGVSTSKSKDDIISLAKQEAYTLCAKSNIELNDNRKNIIDQFIILGIGTIIKLPEETTEPLTVVINQDSTEDKKDETENKQSEQTQQTSLIVVPQNDNSTQDNTK